MDRRTFLRGTFVFLAAPALIASAQQKKQIILGRSQIIVPRNGRVGAQIDRVLRDIAWTESRFDASMQIPASTRDKNTLVPYMEGRLCSELVDYAGATIVGLTPCRARRKDGVYYANDGATYRFEIDASKVAYQTVRFEAGNEYATMPDTHGFNMVAEQALAAHKKQHLALAIACMDKSSKAAAALLLAQKGINCYGPCDHMASDLLGHTAPGVIIGTAPIRKHSQGAVIGAQEVALDIGETIVVQAEAPDPTRNLYCDTPRIYFQALARYLKLELNLRFEETAVGEAGKVVAVAHSTGARAIGVRVFNKADAEPIAEWLAASESHRAILFHSAAYDEGYKLFFDFPKQTSFGDLRPVVA